MKKIIELIFSLIPLIGFATAALFLLKSCIGDFKELFEDSSSDQEYSYIFYINKEGTLHLRELGNNCFVNDGYTRFEGEEVLESLKIDSICHKCYMFVESRKEYHNDRFKDFGDYYHPILEYIDDHPEIKH